MAQLDGIDSEAPISDMSQLDGIDSEALISGIKCSKGISMLVKPN